MRPFRDLIGQSFGLWRVIERGPNTKQRKPQWLCECACGTCKLVSTSHLTRKTKPSRDCGCLRTRTGRAIEFHNQTTTPEYYIWSSMIARCLNPKANAYAHYGGRGISVCCAWQASFLTFYADMGPRPTPTHMLDRIDNDQGYNKENCRWTIPSVQYRNRRSNRWLTFHDRTECLADWALITGISRQTIEHRIDYYGWSIEQALTTPIMRLKRRINK
jgi:hypothetical protein